MKIYCPWCYKEVSHRWGIVLNHDRGTFDKCPGSKMTVEGTARVNREATRRLGWGVDGIVKVGEKCNV
jgi:hypothetical protein